jgi:hypothetical protein
MPSSRPWLAVAVVVVLWALAAPRGTCLDERAALLVELSIAYGDGHLDSASSLVVDSDWVPNVAELSLPYAVALLETNTSITRARGVVEAVLAAQDQRPKSLTRGGFRWLGTADAPYSLAAIYALAPSLAQAYAKHAEVLGEGCALRLRGAMELALGAIAVKAAPTPDEELQRLAAVAQLSRALGVDGKPARAVATVTRWVQQMSTGGRSWTPSPSGDVTRLLALQYLWETLAEADRAPVEAALRLCYLDFAQRVHAGVPILAGAAGAVRDEEYLDASGLPRWLIYRDFGLRAPGRAKPNAVTVVLATYRPPADIVALVTGERDPYTVESASAPGPATSLTPALATTYMTKQFAMGTMTGWCQPQSVPLLVTFAQYKDSPSAYAWVHGGPAHVSSLQYSNFALCSFNFDRVGVGTRERAWVKVCLGNAADIDEVDALGSAWDGEPIAVGSRGTVAVKRGGAYLAFTLLECGQADAQEAPRRKPGVLEWEGQGEHAALMLTVYARQEEYALKKLEDDWRAGFAVQVWGADQFPTVDDCVRWLYDSRIAQTYATTSTKTPEAQVLDPVLDKHRPQARRRYSRTTNKVQTIEYSYQRGKGTRLKLVEDLRHESVVGRAVNDQPWASGQWWWSPGLSWVQGKSLQEALAPPKPAG